MAEWKAGTQVLWQVFGHEYEGYVLETYEVPTAGGKPWPHARLKQTGGVKQKSCDLWELPLSLVEKKTMSTFDLAKRYDPARFFVTSDTHYHHKNLCAGLSKWPDVSDLRQFQTLDENDRAVVDGINSVVPEDGELFHIGDWSLGGEPRIREFRRQLKVKTIHLIWGNHDERIIKAPDLYGDVFTSIQPYLEVKVGQRLMVLFHYAQRVWNRSHKGTFHLHGHSHGSLPGLWGRSMDVGMDTNNYRPYTFEQIDRILGSRTIRCEDHHKDRD